LLPADEGDPQVLERQQARATGTISTAVPTDRSSSNVQIIYLQNDFSAYKIGNIMYILANRLNTTDAQGQ
jgi:hypothetical protein